MKNENSEAVNTNLPAQQTDNLPAATTDDAPAVTGARQIELTTMDDLTKAVELANGLGDVKDLEVGTINLKSEYLSFEEKGEKVRRVFLGFTMRMSVDPVTAEEKGLIPAAQLYDPETQTISVCMQKVLVGVLFEVGYPRGAALEITYLGKKKAKNSALQYDNFDIRALVPQKK